MIDRISEKLTGLIKENMDGITEEKAEVINYGLNLFTYEIVSSFFILLTAWFLGLFKSILIFYAVFGLIRTFAGGAHARTRLECAVTFIVSSYGSVLLAKYFRTSSVYIGILLFISAILIVALYAPGDTEEKPVSSSSQKRNLKTWSFVILTSIFLVASIVWRFDKSIYSLIIYSTLPAIFLLSPAGYKLLGCKRTTT